MRLQLYPVSSPVLRQNFRHYTKGKNTGSLLLRSLTDDRFILLNYHFCILSELNLLETMQTSGKRAPGDCIFVL